MASPLFYLALYDFIVPKKQENGLITAIDIKQQEGLVLLPFDFSVIPWTCPPVPVLPADKIS